MMVYKATLKHISLNQTQDILSARRIAEMGCHGRYTGFALANRKREQMKTYRINNVDARKKLVFLYSQAKCIISPCMRLFINLEMRACITYGMFNPFMTARAIWLYYLTFDAECKRVFFNL